MVMFMQDFQNQKRIKREGCPSKACTRWSLRWRFMPPGDAHRYVKKTKSYKGVEAMAHVFLSYVREDQELIAKLALDLRKAGVEVWLDRDRISPGQRWQLAIQGAIEDGVFFIACFSSNYESRNRSYMNEELILAAKELRLRPVERAWFIPVILSDCSVPQLEIGPGETFRDIQWVDLRKEWDKGIRSILNTIQSSVVQPLLTPDEMRVLGSLTGHPEFTLRSISGISKDTAIDQERVKSILDTLVETGLAGETAGKKGIRWSITQKGAAVLESLSPNEIHITT